MKRTADGTTQRFKACLDARGYTPTPGIDYTETFSPAVKFDSIRTCLSIAAEQDLEILQFDVKTAFLHGDLQEEIYMTQLLGFEDCMWPHRVCKLRKSLYSLKQSSRAWNYKFNALLTKYQLIPSVADPCVYYSFQNDSIIIMTIYVDDGLLFYQRNSNNFDILGYMEAAFEYTCGAADCYVGIRITRDRASGQLFVGQQH